MKVEDLRIVQEIATEILFDIVDVCEKNNIEYFMLYGTLIGAVRHQGMIPWDDDIDIGMTRENYEKFLSIADKQLAAENQMILMGSKHTLSEIKVGRRGTYYCIKGTEELNIANQITVDIFLIDYVKEKSPIQQGISKKVRWFLRMCSLNWDEKSL